MIGTLAPSKWVISFLLCLTLITHGRTQNIVTNPSFETYSVCPTTYGNGGALECTPWQNGNMATADYFNACAVGTDVWVPDNLLGSQPAHTGDAYAGFYTRESSIWREYVQVPLTEPCVAGFNYVVSFYVSLADFWCGVENIGAHLSATPPPGNTIGTLNVTPQVEANLGFITDNQNWVLITGCFTAQGGEAWITIGNFYNNANTPLDPACDISYGSYYYVDDVSVMQGDPSSPLDLELGDPVITCDPYEIDPGVTGVEYLWSDGSSDPTLVVTISGTYSLTITSGCDQAIDSVEVIFEGVPDDVEIGPPTVSFCNGDSYEISLDPEAGDYLWQDGSTDPNYSITTPGIYQVTLDDGCDVTTDEMTVIVWDAPPPFSLGEDALLCSGDEITFSFDPDLGDFLWQDNSTSSEYTVTTGGNYALTISNQCGEVSDEILINDMLPPVVDLGPEEIILCDGQSYVIDLDPNQGDYEWQDGSTSSSYSISSPGQYSVTVTNACGSSSDMVEVNVTTEPVFDLGPDIVICPGQLPILLDVSSASNATSFLWQDNSTDSQFAVDEEGTYSVTVSNACFSLSDQIEIIVEDASPVVSLPQDQLLCEGETITLDGNGLLGDYVWQDGSTSSSYIVDHEGTYSLTVSNQCGSGSDEIIVTYLDPLPVPDLGPDISLCPGEQFVLYAGITGVNYSWQDMSTADSLLVTIPGMYILNISNICSTASDTIMVAMEGNPPDVDLPESINLCLGEMVTLDAGIQGVQYIWNDGSQSSTLSVSTPGIYSVTVSNSCGMDEDSVVIVNAGTLPSVSLDTALSICPGETVLLSPVASNVDSWLWSDGSTGSSYNVTSPGMVAVQVTNQCGVTKDSIVISILPSIPALQLGADTSICPGEVLTLSITFPDVNILWPDSSAGSNYTVSDSGQVYASISNQCGVSSDTLHIGFLPASPQLNLGMDQSLCPGETIVLSPGIADVDYRWQDGSMGDTYTTMIPGMITLTVSNTCGAAKDTLVITENVNGPDVNLGDDVVACVGEVVTLQAGISGVDYVWQDGSTEADFSTSVSGIFILQVSNACGMDADTVNVDISGEAPTAFLGPDTTFCEGLVFQLQANTDGSAMIQWQDGSSAPFYDVTSAGTYVLTVSNTCGSASDTILVSIQTAPELFELGPDTVLCPGEFLVLMAPVTTNLITWQDGSHEVSMMADEPQTYSIEVSNNCGSISDEISVQIDERIPSVTLEDEISLCQGEIATLDATQSFDATYQWSTGSADPLIEVDQPGIYGVTVSTACSAIHQEIEIIPGSACETSFYIPNIFTPNGDQVNDEFGISFGDDMDVETLSCSIFDRWGNQVFNSHETHFTWDGRFKNEALSPGVYVYLINLTYLDHGREMDKRLTGDITLVR